MRSKSSISTSRGNRNESKSSSSSSMVKNGCHCGLFSSEISNYVMIKSLAPGDLVKKAWDLCNQD